MLPLTLSCPRDPSALCCSEPRPCSEPETAPASGPASHRTGWEPPPICLVFRVHTRSSVLGLMPLNSEVGLAHQRLVTWEGKGGDREKC